MSHRLSAHRTETAQKGIYKPTKSTNYKNRVIKIDKPELLPMPTRAEQHYRALYRPTRAEQRTAHIFPLVNGIQPHRAHIPTAQAFQGTPYHIAPPGAPEAERIPKEMYLQALKR